MKITQKPRTLIFWVNEGTTGDVQFFLEGDKVITAILEEDGCWVGNEFNTILKHFSIKVVRPKKLTKSQEKAYLEYAKKCGFLSENEE